MTCRGAQEGQRMTSLVQTPGWRDVNTCSMQLAPIQLSLTAVNIYGSAAGFLLMKFGGLGLMGGEDCYFSNNHGFVGKCTLNNGCGTGSLQHNSICFGSLQGLFLLLPSGQHPRLSLVLFLKDSWSQGIVGDRRSPWPLSSRICVPESY